VTCNIVCHTIENTHSLLYCTVKVDNTREEINPDDLAKGVPFYMSSNAMSELMEFLAYYARLIHSNRYYRSVLLNNPGATFMDIITASDIAYAITLVKNNLHVWTQQHENAKNESDKDKDKDKDNEVSKKKVKTLKPLFTAGKGKKRTFGNSTWNDEGKEFFKETLEAWKPAFNKNDVQYRCLRRHWDRWVETAGRDMLLDLTGLQSRTMYDLFRIREEGENVPSSNKKRVEVDGDEDFEYESEEEDGAVDMGSWSRRQSMCDDGDDAEEGDGGGGDDDEDGGDDDEDNYDAGGDDDDDDDEFLSSTSKEMLDDGDEEEGCRSKKGVDTRKAPSVAIATGDNGSDDEDDDRSRNEVQKEIEAEAKAAGMSTRRVRGKRAATVDASVAEEKKNDNRKRQGSGDKGGRKLKRGKQG
jgi:hypothetical protein